MQYVELAKQHITKNNFVAFKDIFCGTFSSTVGALAVAIRNIISLSYIGHNNNGQNDAEMSAASFGITWINAFGYSLLFGFSIGLSTMVSQAFGAKKYKAMGLFLHRTLIIMGALVLLMGIFFWNTESILLYYGFEKELAYNVGLHSKGSILSCAGYGLAQALRYYISALKIFHITAVINVVGIFIHMFFCHLMIDVFDWGVLGMAIARALTELASAGLYYLYLKRYNPCPEAMIPVTRESFAKLAEHTKEMIYHGSAIYAEWMALQISSLMVGFLGQNDVISAHGSVITYLVYIQSFSLGVSVSTTTYVGNFAGEGSVSKVKRYATVGAILEGIVCVLIFVVTFGWRGEIADLYTEKEDINRLIRIILILYCLGMFADYGSNFLAFILRTLNQQRIVTICFAISYYLVGAPLSYFFGFSLGLGIWGIWAGILLGYWTMLSLMVWRTRLLRLTDEVMLIQKLMREKEAKGIVEGQTFKELETDDDSFTTL